MEGFEGMKTRTWAMTGVLTALLLLPGCSSNGEGETPSGGLSVRAIVERLADDQLQGRGNQTPGAASTRALLIEELKRFAEPIRPDLPGDEGFLQEFATGTNVLAVVRGGELADEYLMIGAHYDGLGTSCSKANCDDVTGEDQIYNGATDNATGVAAVIEVVRSILADQSPRRSIIIALWDAEEDGLQGSRWYAQNPILPLEQTVAYINFDIQGSNLLPSLARSTILVGAETGGPNLAAAARRATEASSLQTLILSLIFGQGRSDHASLVGAGVPAVFFTDATSGCYHTVKDDIEAVDFPKLDQQIAAAEALTRDLLATNAPPTFETASLPATYEDAVGLLAVLSAAQEDFVLLGTDQEAATDAYLEDLERVVDAGETSFDGAATGVVLGGAAQLVTALANMDCDPFLP